MRSQPLSHFLYPDAPRGTHAGTCALCGFDGPGQYERRAVLDKLTSNMTALFDLNRAHICAPCYGVWSKPKHWHRGIFATPGRVRFPVIAVESATDERPTWGAMLRQLRADEARAIVLTTDPKKRVWPSARVSIGNTCLLYLHDPSRGVSGNRAISIKQFPQALDLAERAYRLGFSKERILSGLLGDYRTAQKVGLSATIPLESELAALRHTPEFLPAVIVAQKENNTE